MVKSKNEISNKEYYKDIHFLYEIINELKSVEDIKNFLKDILSSSELRMIKKRWHIANLVKDGLDIRTVANMAQSGTQTVLRMKRSLEEGHGGLRLAILRMEEKIKKGQKKYIESKRQGQNSKFMKKWFG